jgi:hypothetical protein
VDAVAHAQTWSTLFGTPILVGRTAVGDVLHWSKLATPVPSPSAKPEAVLQY